MATSYSNPGGSGNRTGTITVSATGHTGTPATVVNGNTASDFTFYFSGGTGCSVTFQFSVPKIIDEAKFYQSSAVAHGTWQWEGSPDGATWTAIGSTFTLGATNPQTITTLAGNTTPYRYHRARQVSGTASSGPWVYEFEFQIDELSVPATVTRVNFVEGVLWNATAATTYASPAQSVTAGNTLVACVGGYATSAQTVTGVTDTAGHTYTKAAHVFESSDNYRQEVWVAASITTHAANIVTATWSAALGFRGIVVMQYHGLDPVTPFDVTAQNTSGFTTPTLTATTAESLHVLMSRWGIGTTVFPFGFTTVTAAGGSKPEVADRVTTGGPFIGTHTITGGNYFVLAVLCKAGAAVPAAVETAQSYVWMPV